jgi:hypothetical protein
MSTNWVVAVIAILAVAVLVVVLVCCFAGGRNSSNTVPRPAEIVRKQTRVLAAAETAAATDDGEFDVAFTIHNGMPQMTIDVDGRSVRCVPDTGSHEINIASDACSDCNPAYGSVPHQQGLKQSETKYTTQHDIVHESNGLVQIGGRAAQMPFLMTVHRKVIGKGAMNLNVCGLLDGSRGGVAAQHLLPRHSFMVFSFRGDGAGGRFFSVPRHAPAAQPANYTIATPWVRKGHHASHFVVAVQSLVPVASASAGDVGSCAVRYALIDTGSNTSSLPPCAFQRLAPALRRNAPLHLFFGGNERRPLLLPHQSYRHQLDPRGLLTLDDRIGSVGDNDTVLLGTPAFRGYELLFTDTHLCIRPSGF